MNACASWLASTVWKHFARAILTFRGSTLLVRQILSAAILMRLLRTPLPAAERRSKSAVATAALGAGSVDAADSSAATVVLRSAVMAQARMIPERVGLFFILFVLRGAQVRFPARRRMAGDADFCAPRRIEVLWDWWNILIA